MSGARLVINDSISCQVESVITDKGEVEARQERTENSLQISKWVSFSNADKHH